MTEVIWKEGEGLKYGLPDQDWATRKLLTVYPTKHGWRVTVCWGDTWGHLVIKTHEKFEPCFSQAIRQAVREGCPKEWLPEPLDGVDSE